MIDIILKQAVSGEFDYNLLLFCLSDYKNPRKQITKLLKNKDIIRVKKGIYVFGPKIDAPAYSLEVLANLIYGPSYISCEYALSYYGLIPERVNVVTSITNKRNKYFKTPVGVFSYKYLPQDKYARGITQIKIDETRNAIMAVKEKALIDILFKEKNISSVDDMRSYLLDNLRIEEESLKELNINQILEINEIFKSELINILICYIERIQP